LRSSVHSFRAGRPPLHLWRRASQGVICPPAFFFSFRVKPQSNFNVGHAMCPLNKVYEFPASPRFWPPDKEKSCAHRPKISFTLGLRPAQAAPGTVYRWVGSSVFINICRVCSSDLRTWAFISPNAAAPPTAVCNPDNPNNP